MSEKTMEIKPFKIEVNTYPGAQGFITDFMGQNWIIFPPNIKDGVGTISVVAYFILESERNRLKEFLATVEAIANDPDYSSPELMVRHIRAAIAAAKEGDHGKV